MRTLQLEFRVHVRQGGLTVTVLDVDSRVPLLPSVALAWQALSPTPDRDALRVLARFESGNPRHPAVDVRGEDVAELLPLLRERRVLLEPALMQLRFADEPLRPRFDLEMVGGDTIVVKVSFERPSDRRRFSLTSGGWFEGAPGWHIDTSEGIARPLDKRVSPAALRRLLRSPTIAEPAAELVRIITQGLPKVALEVGAELPELSQVADVIDLEPHVPHARGRLAHRGRGRARAAYGDVEIEVRADGISPPVIILPPRGGAEARPLHPLRHRRAAGGRGASCSTLGPRCRTRAASPSSPRATTRSASGREGVGALPEDWDLFVPEDLVDTQVRGKPVAMQRARLERRRLAERQAQLRERGRRRRSRRARALPREGKKYVRLRTTPSRRSTPSGCRRCSIARSSS